MIVVARVKDKKDEEKAIVLDVSKAFEVTVDDKSIVFYFPNSVVRIDAEVKDPRNLADKIATFMKTDIVTNLDTLLKMAGGGGSGEEVQGGLRPVREEDEGRDEEQSG